MAARRITKSNINWKEIAERVPIEQRPQFLAFKTRSETYVKKMFQYPENPPKIDWEMYRTKISVAGMVDNFKKSYESLNIPFPPDNVTKQIDEQEKVIKAEVEAFKNNSNKNIEQYNSKLNYLKGLLPFDQMTMEDFRDSYPDLALDPINKPTFWPHDAEEQTDFRDKGHPFYGTKPQEH